MVRSLGARLASPLASSVDRLVARGLTGRSASARQRSRAESLGPAARRRALEAIAAEYDRAAPFEDSERFFGASVPCDPALSRAGVRRAGKVDVEVLDARWPSATQTFCRDEALAARFSAVKENELGAARLFLGRGRPRPAVILVHGYRGGQYAIEERMWPVSWLLERGLDVALFVLPFHAVRAETWGAPRFPGSDPRFTNEGLRQAIVDLRALTGHLMERGAPLVGAMGMSLGGYTVSLLATVEPRLGFTAPMIPLASFADVALAAGRLVGSEEEQHEQHALLERAHAVASPFTRTPKVEREGLLVVAGEGDRITPIAHAERLARHFDSDLFRFPGGHLLQFGRREGFRAIGRMMRSRGFFDAP